VLVGASLGGVASLLAIGEAPRPWRGLVLVDVAPTIEAAGTAPTGDFVTANLEHGFGSLEEVADAIAAYNPIGPGRAISPDSPRTSASETTGAGSGTGIRASCRGGWARPMRPERSCSTTIA
jgi:pimeloyl-ACP methyl ester carboxylesterase